MSTKAAKLLERMRRTKSGWGQIHFDRLLTGFGFIKGGKKEAIYTHPDHSELRISIPRHNSLKKWVARDAVKLIDELLEINKGDE